MLANAPQVSFGKIGWVEQEAEFCGRIKALHGRLHGTDQ
jgi:hypothetical protein